MTDSLKTQKNKINTELVIERVLSTIEREREREIISRRFGLFDRKETLEQIGEMLGITRERVRQLEKSVLSKLKSLTQQGSLKEIEEAQQIITNILEQDGYTARISDLCNTMLGTTDRIEQSRIAFIALLCPKIYFVNDDDSFFLSVGLKEYRDEKSHKKAVTNIINTIKIINESAPIQEIAEKAQITNPTTVKSLASTSKHLATLNGRWGLLKWPSVNPKNIRDKIYVILKENGTHMHFNEIADAIKKSEFKRKNVTTQAIHNELIKDKRFVLIGRGIYALKEWGYQKGTVSDIITDVLKEAGQPLHRDEIVKLVLKSRFVKETTILLNLQGKTKFKRVAKGTYGLAE